MEKETKYELWQFVNMCLGREENELPKHFDALRDICHYICVAKGEDFTYTREELLKIDDAWDELRDVMKSLNRKLY